MGRTVSTDDESQVVSIAEHDFDAGIRTAIRAGCRYFHAGHVGIIKSSAGRGNHICVRQNGYAETRLFWNDPKRKFLPPVRRPLDFRDATGAAFGFDSAVAVLGLSFPSSSKKVLAISGDEMPPAPENHAVQLLGTRAMSQRQKMKPYPPLK